MTDEHKTELVICVLIFLVLPALGYPELMEFVLAIGALFFLASLVYVLVYSIIEAHKFNSKRK